MLVRRLATALVLLTASPAALAADGAPYPPVVTFAVVRNGETIGRHVITFRQQGASRVVTVHADISVRMMGVAAYRYVHHDNEVWNGDQLVSLQATTDDNGRKSTVRAERTPKGLAVERTTSAPVATAALNDQGFQGPAISRELLPAGTLPTVQWNMRQVSQSALLNTQDGTLARIRVVPAGRETVVLRAGAVSAMRYTYSGDLRMDQWFDDQGRWVKGTFAAFDGSTIEYILQE